jgi:hypothetical protein
MTGVANLSTFGIVWAMLSATAENASELTSADETAFRVGVMMMMMMMMMIDD